MTIAEDKYGAELAHGCGTANLPWEALEQFIAPAQTFLSRFGLIAPGQGLDVVALALLASLAGCVQMPGHDSRGEPRPTAEPPAAPRDPDPEPAARPKRTKKKKPADPRPMEFDDDGPDESGESALVYDADGRLMPPDAD